MQWTVATTWNVCSILFPGSYFVSYRLQTPGVYNEPQLVCPTAQKISSEYKKKTDECLNGWIYQLIDEWMKDVSVPSVLPTCEKGEAVKQINVIHGTLEVIQK